MWPRFEFVLFYSSAKDEEIFADMNNCKVARFQTIYLHLSCTLGLY